MLARVSALFLQIEYDIKPLSILICTTLLLVPHTMARLTCMQWHLREAVKEFATDAEKCVACFQVPLHLFVPLCVCIWVGGLLVHGPIQARDGFRVKG